MWRRPACQIYQKLLKVKINDLMFSMNFQVFIPVVSHQGKKIIGWIFSCEICHVKLIGFGIIAIYIKLNCEDWYFRKSLTKFYNTTYFRNRKKIFFNWPIIYRVVKMLRSIKINEILQILITLKVNTENTPLLSITGDNPNTMKTLHLIGKENHSK